MLKILLLPFKLARGLFKLTGVKGGIWLGVGVAVGLLVAPQTGAELRAKLQSALAGKHADDVYPDDVDLTL